MASLSRSWSQPQPILRLSAQDLAGSSRVILSSTVPLSYSFEKKPSALVVSVVSRVSLRVQQAAFKSELVESVGWSRGKDSYAFSIELRRKGFSFEHKVRANPFELTIDLKPEEEPTEIAPPVRSAAVTEAPGGAATLPPAVRPTGALDPNKFRTIVVDPGHGGLEAGAKGKFGALEKDITLAIGLKLKDIIEKNLAFRVFLTRDKDTNVSLENRSALANNHKADLFISVHANGSMRKNARGSETYFLSLNATDEESRRLAYMENTSGLLEGQIEEENQDDVKMILWDLAQSAYLKQSSLLAENIQAGLNELLGTLNRGVKQAPFKVLTGVACPAVLVETAFISNPEEEKELGSEEFQNNVAQAIFLSLVEYFKSYP
ncbi:MAG: N-acetylmuramoyl-L-alanine amidase [Candidatus Aminicenantes bacterium]|nr:N-acetylmuramoyl-L-alanine amidase [Candidatus Aminicenantes bacterium]